MAYQEHDTIAAVSTAVSEAGISIIRVSGPDALEVTDRVFKSPKKDFRLADAPGYTMHYGHIYDGGTPVDEVLVCVMRAPHSYTAEDTAEINCHGGVYATGRVLELVRAAGARAAEPGEFTRRAFLNGRIDLTRAEAVMDVIRSDNEYALKNAALLLGGALHDKIASLRNEILQCCARIESALDDPEHYTLEGFSGELRQSLQRWEEEMEALIRSYGRGKLIAEGIRTVILGRPNAGKSSLLNALLRSERAIVTDVAGTTRDTLTESVSIGSVSLRITDTAGIRETQDIVEKIGVEKAVENAKDADLILCVIDGSSPLSAEDRQVFRLLKGKKRILLINKSDLPRGLDEKEMLLMQERDEAGEKVPVVEISARYGSGIEELEKTIEEMFFRGELQGSRDLCITRERQKELLGKAAQSLRMVSQAMDAGMEEDFFTIDLMDAYAHLGGVIGETPEDDLADRIFSEFCMGK